MHAQSIVYVTEMPASIAWYSTLFDTEPDLVSDHWTTFSVGGTTIALHATDQARPDGNVALSLVAPRPLERVAERFSVAHTIVDQPFGRSFVVTDPDGTSIQVNEHLD